MPDYSSHRIDRVRFSLGTGRAASSLLQNRCSQLFHQQLKYDLDRLLSDLPVIHSLSIERLVLDLGDIPAEQFEAELRRRVLMALSEQLKEIIANAPPPESDVPAAAQAATANRAGADDTVAQGEETAARKTLTPDYPDPYCVLPPDEALTLLMNWLERGVPVAPQRWQTAGGPDGWLLHYLFPADTDAPLASVQIQRWKRVFAGWCWQSVPLRRLTRTFSRATLKKLAQWLADGTPQQDLPPVTQDPPDVWLPLFALLFFRHDTEPAASAVVRPWPGAQSLARSKTAHAWLQQWSARSPSPIAAPPLRAVAQQWLDESAGVQTRAAEQAAATRKEKNDKLPRELSSSAMPEAEALPVGGAGIALLWPMLPRWLSETGLVAQQRFVDDAARHKAVQWLDALVWGWPEPDENTSADELPAIPEWRMTLARFLCGLPPDTLLEPWELTAAGRAEHIGRQEQWLAALPRQLSQLHRFSVQDVRNMFLQRSGLLYREEEHWVLQVEADAGDILLHDIPWPMTQMVLPWLMQPLAVEWLAGQGGSAARRRTRSVK